MLSSRAGRALQLGGVGAEAGADLAWAWLNIGAAAMGATIVERLEADQMDVYFNAISKVPWEICEVAAMSLAFEDSMTALDLCADAVFLACGHQRQANGQFYDVGQLRKKHLSLSPTPSVFGWIDKFLAAPDLGLLEECRHALAHRQVRRDYMVTLEAGSAVKRALSEITMLPNSNHPAQSKGSIGSLIPRLVGFAETQIEALCEAILKDYPAPL